MPAWLDGKILLFQLALTKLFRSELFSFLPKVDHCSRSKQFWIEFELYWCLISNQRIRLFGILTENACPLLQLLNYFIIIGKLYLWDCGSKQILPNIYGFRAKIIAKYETEEKISNKEFFKRKWILSPYLS